MSLKAVTFTRFAGAPNLSPTATMPTPTYDGSGVTTEPTWIKKPSWVTAVGTDLLSHNPLTGGSDEVENPSLLISSDNGSTWTTPPGLTNPISPKPTPAGQPGHNADCHLFADPNTNRLIMTWLVSSDPTVVNGGNQNGFWYSVCTDPTLVTWSPRAQLFSLNGVGAPAISSTEQEPKIVWDAVRGKYLLFTQDTSPHPNVIKMRVAATSDPLGTYGAPVTCSVPIPDGQGDGPWHMDIFQEASGRFVMAFNDSFNPGTLSRRCWLASSPNGIAWRVAPRPLMKINGWAVAGIYRPSIQPARTGSGYDLIVSRHQSPSAQLGLVRNVPTTELP